MQRYPKTPPPRETLSPLGTLATLVGAGVAAYLTARTMIRRRRYLDLNGTVAIVTGGSRGIGLEIARELARRGARITICARNERELRAAQEELEQIGAQVLAITCDVTQQDEIANVVHQTRQHFGPIDVLINNAGIISVGPVSHMSLADYRDAMDINFEAPLLFMLEVMPEMRERGSGRIVNITSFGGKVATPHLAPYCASKFALVGLSETLRMELADDGVFVTTVCPGLTRSGSSVHALFKGQQAKEHAWFKAGANAPLITISSARLARKVVDALQHGDAEVIAPLIAKLQVMMNGVCPNTVSTLGTLANALLPGRTDDRVGDHARSGGDVEEHSTAAGMS
jgi:short-subunit dehydrogenase